MSKQKARTIIHGKPLARLFLGCVSTLAFSMPENSQLIDLSLEELADIPIVQSGKKKQRLFDTPAGAFVLGRDAIENLPADSIPEMLRYAPGMHMMRSTNGTWGMGIRGLNSRFLGRSIFSVDDQSLYGNLYAGLYGSQHDLFLDDVAAVEVVYGPGGGLWGPNSGNGRVNVILKSAFETEGSLLRAQVGSEEKSVAARIGWTLDANSAMRVSAKAANRQASFSQRFQDDWDTYRVGFQYDNRPSTSDLVSVSGELYSSVVGSSRDAPDFSTGAIAQFDSEERHRGFNSQVKWNRQIDADNGVILRAWVGASEIRAPYANFDLGVAGAEARGRLAVGRRHRFIFTGGVTYDDPDDDENPFTTFRRSARDYNITAHAGSEYSFSLRPDELELSIGLSGSYDTYSDNIEPLPSARIMYRPAENSRIWASYSRSTRNVPPGISGSERVVRGAAPIEPIEIPTPFGNFTVAQQFITNEAAVEIENEDLDAFEIGYRHQFSDTSSLSINVFRFEYGNMIVGLDDTRVPVLDVPTPYLLFNIIIDNGAEGSSEGLECSISHEFTQKLSATLGYARVRNRFEAISTSFSPATMPALAVGISTLNNPTPEHLANAWLQYELSQKWRADLGVRYSASFSNLTGSQPSIFQADMRLSWQPNEHLRLSLLGRNLLDPLTDEGLLKDSVGYTTQQRREASIELRYDF